MKLIPPAYAKAYVRRNKNDPADAGAICEFGIVVAEGPHHIGELLRILFDPQDDRIPALLKEGLMRLAETLERQIEGLDKAIVAWGRGSETCRRLITVPGYGPILSSAMAATVVNPAVFRSGRDFSASLGLTPRQDGTGGKAKLGPISKRGNGYLRRLLVNGAMSVLNSKRARQNP